MKQNTDQTQSFGVTWNEHPWLSKATNKPTEIKPVCPTWYTDLIIPSTGPETFNGLPGTILGLANEDGGVVYFAKNIKEAYVDIDLIKPSTKKKDLFTENELRDKLKKRAKGSPWMSKLIGEVFAW